MVVEARTVVLALTRRLALLGSLESGHFLWAKSMVRLSEQDDRVLLEGIKRTD